MTTVEAASALLARIEALVLEANLEACSIDLYRVTAGEPAAPAGACSVISVWASEYFNSATSLFHEDNPCVVVRGVRLNWRLDLCFTETEKDRPAAVHLADATCLYGLGDTIWCGIIRSVKEIFSLQCSAWSVDPLLIAPALGGIYSASSGVRLQLDCPPEPVS